MLGGHILGDIEIMKQIKIGITSNNGTNAICNSSLIVLKHIGCLMLKSGDKLQSITT